MNRPAYNFRSLLVMIALLAVSGTAFGQNHIEWRFDLDKAKQVAAEQDKLVLLHFSATWCRSCKEIERFVFVNPMAIQSIATQVVPVKIDVDVNKNIATEYGVTSVPFDIVITPAGHVVTQQSSPRSSDGYLQLIQQSRSIAANLTDDVIRDVANLKQEIRRQQQQANASLQPQTFGTIPREDTNQFVPTGQTTAGVRMPKFQGPDAWAASETPLRTASTDMTTGSTLSSRTSSFQAQAPAQPSRFAATAPAHAAPTPPQQPRSRLASSGSFVPNGSGHPLRQPSVKVETTSTRTQGFLAPKETPVAEPLKIVNSMATAPQTPKTGFSSDNPVAAAAPSTTSPMKTGLDGYCGVSLMEHQKWVRGEKNWGCIHRGQLYLFASQEYRDRFRQSPDMYSPLLSGADPVEFYSSGKLVEGKRKNGVFYGDDGGPTVIVLFTNRENRDQFEADPAGYLQTVRQAMSQADGDLLLR